MEHTHSQPLADSAVLVPKGMPDEFDAFLETIQRRFDNLKLSRNEKPLFHATLPTHVNLDEFFLAHLPIVRRQEHTCFCCMSFLRKYGNLVYVNDSGVLVSALWDVDGVPDLYHMAVHSMKEVVEKTNRIERVFVHDASGVVGTAATGDWRHLHIKNIHPSLGQFTVGHHPNEYMVDFRILHESLASYSGAMVKNMINLFESGAVPDAERFLAPARWLAMIRDGLNNFPTGAGSNQRRNWMLREIVKAPAGFARPANTVIGTFLDDLRDGASFEVAKKKFLDKVNPVKYQRPTAEVSDGNIAQAEKLIAHLGCEKSMLRRYGKLEDLTFLWKPIPPVETVKEEGGIFDHLKKGKEAAHEEVIGGAVNISWVKFVRTVLPNVKSMEMFLAQVMTFGGYATAVHPDAPPILKWDTAEKRNPVSWWVRLEPTFGSHTSFISPRHFGLEPLTWVEVEGVTLPPALWTMPDEFDAAYGGRAFFVLKGARDKQGSSSFLFPEILKGDFHSIRNTIEHFSNTTPAAGRDEDHAMFACFGDGIQMKIRVKTDMGTSLYILDRWE